MTRQRAADIAVVTGWAAALTLTCRAAVRIARRIDWVAFMRPDHYQKRDLR